MEKFLKFTGQFIWGVVLFIVSLLMYGLAVSLFWRWNIVPHFPLPDISFPQAVIITFVLKAIGDFNISIEKVKKSMEYEHEPIETKIAYQTTVLFLVPVVIILYSYLVSILAGVL